MEGKNRVGGKGGLHPYGKKPADQIVVLPLETSQAASLQFLFLALCNFYNCFRLAWDTLNF